MLPAVFFGIGILPVSDSNGRSVFWSVLLIWRELLFSAKGGLAVSKRGPGPLFEEKKGFPPKKWYQNVPTEISFGIGVVNTEKYPPIPTGKYQFNIQLYLNQIMYNRDFFHIIYNQMSDYIIRVRLLRKGGGKRKKGARIGTFHKCRIIYNKIWIMYNPTWIIHNNKILILYNPTLIIKNGDRKTYYVSFYWWILNIEYSHNKQNLNFDTFFLMKCPIWPHQNPNTVGKLSLSAFQQYWNLGVMDRVFLTK